MQRFNRYGSAYRRGRNVLRSRSRPRPCKRRSTSTWSLVTASGPSDRHSRTSGGNASRKKLYVIVVAASSEHGCSVLHQFPPRLLSRRSNVTEPHATSQKWGFCHPPGRCVAVSARSRTCTPSSWRSSSSALQPSLAGVLVLLIHPSRNQDRFQSPQDCPRIVFAKKSTNGSSSDGIYQNQSWLISGKRQPSAGRAIFRLMDGSRPSGHTIYSRFPWFPRVNRTRVQPDTKNGMVPSSPEANSPPCCSSWNLFESQPQTSATSWHLTSAHGVSG